LLVDIEQLDWETAWDITTQTFGLRSPRRPLVATLHDGGTRSHVFLRCLHDCRKIPTFFARLSQMARGYMV